MDTSLQDILILLLVLIFSMSIHEMMHAFAADRLGDDTARLHGRLTLNPLPHIDPFLTVGIPLILLITGAPVLFGAANPGQVNFSRLKYGDFGGAIVGVVGPLTNLVIACLSALLFNSLNLDASSAIYIVFGFLITLNVGLFVFNMIPWPPLDGSRLLHAFAPKGLQNVMESIEQTGLVGLVVFIFLFYQIGGPIQNLMIHLVDILAPSLAL
jgi:Zn-dependent protease